MSDHETTGETTAAGTSYYDPRIYPQLSALLGQTLEVDADRIKPESTLVEDLGADSLDMIEIVMAIEEKFDIAITDDAAEQVKSVADAVRVIDDALHARAAAAS